jgi:surface antigen
MRFTAVLAGVLLCTVVFLTDSPKASAETNNNANKLTSTDVLTLLDGNSLADELANNKEETKKPVKTAVEHVVSNGDTLVSIANTYNTDWVRIFNKNENITNPDILNPGITIVIPSNDEELPDRAKEMQVEAPAETAPSTSTSYQQPQTISWGSSAGNTYVPGYCTWYAKQMRPDLPNQLGNAYSWVANARARGIPTGSEPRVGAIGQSGNHVVYVKKINNNGTITISDMNYAGIGVVTTRVVPKYSHTYIY